MVCCADMHLIVLMVDGNLFEMISDIARQLHRCQLAFGGMQVWPFTLILPFESHHLVACHYR